tara:strand:+ start:1461 stop:1625 length:165 start_codon:yes stop_codon:yes gene_type:complete
LGLVHLTEIGRRAFLYNLSFLANHKIQILMPIYKKIAVTCTTGTKAIINAGFGA